MSLKLLRRRPPAPVPAEEAAIESRPSDAIPIAEVTWRSRVKVAGRVRSMRIQPWAGVATLECTVVDSTGGLAVVFLGRREVAGVHCGTELVVEGMVGEHGGRLAILNPDYEIIPG